MYCAALGELPDSPYHQVIGLQFSNSPSLLAAHFDDCLSRQPRQITIGAAFIVMNGFDINPDRWYGEIFLYPSFGGHGDYEWLVHPHVGTNPDFTLKGMEALQKVFASRAGLDRFGRPTFPEAEDVRAICGLVVLTRFQRLVHRAAAHMKRLSFPLLSSAHDYDLIAEVAPARSCDDLRGK